MGAKRDGKHLHDDSDSSGRRVKVRDLGSVLQSKGKRCPLESFVICFCALGS